MLIGLSVSIVEIEHEQNWCKEYQSIERVREDNCEYVQNDGSVELNCIPT